MGYDAAIRRDEDIEAARETAAKMRAASNDNPTAKTAEVSITAFLLIATLLENLAERLEWSMFPPAGARAGLPEIDRHLLVDTLSAVTTMGGYLGELMAPSEIKEIADAVIDLLTGSAYVTPAKDDALGPDCLERLFKKFSKPEAC